MCSGSEAGSYLRLINFVYQSTLGVSVIEKKTRIDLVGDADRDVPSGDDQQVERRCEHLRVEGLGFRAWVGVPSASSALGRCPFSIVIYHQVY